jgi:hypothetical protein
MGGGCNSGPFVPLGHLWMQWMQSSVALQGHNHVKEDCMNAMVHVNRICGKIKPGDLICEHQSFRSEHIPGILFNAITILAATDDSKVKWAMDIHVTVSEIHPASDSDKLIMSHAIHQCIGWCDQVRIHRTKCGSIAIAVL